MLAWAAYLPWGLLQQYVLNGYFLNRLETLVSRQRGAGDLGGAVLRRASPNWFLMAVTLVAGYFAHGYTGGIRISTSWGRRTPQWGSCYCWWFRIPSAIT